MADSTAARLGGISGILFVALFFRSYITLPDAPVATSRPQDVLDYFANRQDGILLFDGLLLIFAAFFLWFVGVLYGVLRRAEDEGVGLAAVALAGGLLWITLLLAGAAVEILHAATLARFENFRPDAQIGFLSLVLSGWMYRFALVGMSVLIAATSVVVLRTGVLPRWVAFGGFVAALFALLRFLIPWVAYWGCCGWWRSRCSCSWALAALPRSVPGGWSAACNFGQGHGSIYPTSGKRHSRVMRQIPDLVGKFSRFVPELACRELRRTPLLGTWLNKGKESQDVLFFSPLVRVAARPFQAEGVGRG
jgi:hypothetical protein